MFNKEIVVISVLGSLLALFLLGFVVSILFLYQKKQHQHAKELAEMQEQYDQQILRVQFKMQEATLNEISHRLHNDFKNGLTGVINNLSTLSILINKNKIEPSLIVDTLFTNKEEIRVIRDELRLTSHSLSTDRIAQVGLLDAIKFEAKRLSNNENFNIIFAANNKVTYLFKKEESVILFRIFQECIGNIIAHAKATIVNIDIDIVKGNIFLFNITDNGIGFNVAEKRISKNSGIGLMNIYNKAIEIGGTLKIDSKPNVGTIYKIELPLTLQHSNL